MEAQHNMTTAYLHEKFVQMNTMESVDTRHVWDTVILGTQEIAVFDNFDTFSPKNIKKSVNTLLQSLGEMDQIK